MDDVGKVLGVVLIAAMFLIGMVGWIFRVVNWVWLRPKKMEKLLREQGLVGNPYTLLYGDTKRICLMTKMANAKPIHLSGDIRPRVLPFYHHIIQIYGKSSFSWIGPVPRVNIMEPELIKEILVNNNGFKKPTPNPLARFLVCGLSGYEGEKWSKHRKIVNPAFYIDKLKNMLPAMYVSCSEMMKEWEMLTDGNKICELNVQPCIETLTSKVISRTAFGSNYEEGRKIFRLQKEQAELTVQVLHSVYIPGWSPATRATLVFSCEILNILLVKSGRKVRMKPSHHAPYAYRLFPESLTLVCEGFIEWSFICLIKFLPTKSNKRLKEINNELRSLFKGIINRREKSMSLGPTDHDDDLLSLLMKSNQEEIRENGNNKNVGLTTDEIIEECKTFYFAGQESTSNLLTWVMVLLSIHPNWQVRAREEVFQVFGNRKPDYDGLNHLKIVTMIIYEVLRLYPPAIMLTRIIYKETKLGKMTLPPGAQFLLPIFLVHHDPEIWGDDAEEFKPERFAEGVAKATNNRLSFFPFSWGPRICIGNNFAMLEAKMALAMIFQRFSFQLSPTYTHAPSFVLTLKPQYGAHLLLRKI